MAEIATLVEGGKANAGPPLGPGLAPLGVNIGQVVSKINEKTKEYAGMKVPVKVVVNSDKTFEIEVGSPPVSALIRKEINLPKGSATPQVSVGNISIELIKKVAEMKMENLNSFRLRPAIKEVIGSCDSMGVSVEGKRAKDFIKDFNTGMYDSKLGLEPEQKKKKLQEKKKQVVSDEKIVSREMKKLPKEQEEMAEEIAEQSSKKPVKVHKSSKKESDEMAEEIGEQEESMPLEKKKEQKKKEEKKKEAKSESMKGASPEKKPQVKTQKEAELPKNLEKGKFSVQPEEVSFEEGTETEEHGNEDV